MHLIRRSRLYWCHRVFQNESGSARQPRPCRRGHSRRDPVGLQAPCLTFLIDEGCDLPCVADPYPISSEISVQINELHAGNVPNALAGKDVCTLIKILPVVRLVALVSVPPAADVAGAGGDAVIEPAITVGFCFAVRLTSH
jgi:hypothetical protein